MDDLQELFDLLESASRAGRFLSEFARTPLFEEPVVRHPLGFYAARIQSNNGIALRLHLWPAGALSDQPGYEVHDHVFDLRSHALFGSFKQTTFTTREDNLGPSAAYTVEYFGTESMLKKQPGRLVLQPGRQLEIKYGDTYNLRHGILHRLAASEATPGATLILTVPAVTTARTIGPFDGPECLKFQRYPLGSRAGDEYQSLIKS